MNAIWIGLLAFGFLVAAVQGNIDLVTQSAMTGAKLAVESLFELVGIMVLWLGLAKVAEDAGLINQLAKVMKPLLRKIFPSVPPDHPAMGSMLMNISANLLGLGSAATPLGLKAMQELQEINPDKSTASDPMVTFLVLNTAGLSLVPAVMIGLRAQLGSANPTEIVGATLVASAFGTAVGLLADYFFRRRQRMGRR